jgi:hypothetical protein
VTHLAGGQPAASAAAITEGDEAWLVLDDGIKIRFARLQEPYVASYRTGDYWTIPATTDSARCRVAHQRVERADDDEQMAASSARSLPTWWPRPGLCAECSLRVGVHGSAIALQRHKYQQSERVALASPLSA